MCNVNVNVLINEFIKVRKKLLWIKQSRSLLK